jgi:hypothetical protein
MLIGKSINGPVQADTLLYAKRIIKFFFPFHKIADQVSHYNPGNAK